MDKSLSDFQEPKKSCAGPKSKSKAKPKRAPKKIRGQKDIRSALKGKKELESYSKDFDKVCKKAGINIDSEELQLAIAVSKSLQNGPSTSQSETVTSQERIGKIRTTLQEYGFKIPELKPTVRRKQQKPKKNYKLITKPDVEKKEGIANRYSDILFKNITQNLDFVDKNIQDYLSIKLYYLATSVDYNTLKSQDTFYVDNLIEKSVNTGNLLRDWSQIPGRAASPKLFEPSDMNFSEIECSQDEIDVVLSGTLKNCKHVMEKKGVLVTNKCNLDNVNIINFSKDNDRFNDNDTNKYNHEETLKNNKDNQELHCNKQSRSYSPDLFDDDVSILDESYTTEENKDTLKINENNTLIEVTDECDNNIKDKTICDMNMDSLVKNSNMTKRKSNDYMEITDCMEIETKDNNFGNNNKAIATNNNKLNIDILPKNTTKRNSYNLMEITECIEVEPHDIELPISQRSDITKRKSNDFMEITECVATSSQPFIINDRIDLTQICEENIELEKNKDELPNLTIEDRNIDLTEIPDNVNSIIIGQKHNNNKEKEINDVDLTQSSNSDDELPFVSLTSRNDKLSKKDDSLETTIVIDLNEYPAIKKQNKTEAHVDLTQNDTIEISKPSQGFFEEYFHNHSDEQNRDDHQSLEKCEATDDKTTNSCNRNNESNYIENDVPSIIKDDHVIDTYNSNNESNETDAPSLSKDDHVNLTLSPIHKLNDIGDVDLIQSSNDSNLSRCSSQIELIINDSLRDVNTKSPSSANSFKNSQRESTSKNSESDANKTKQSIDASPKNSESNRESYANTSKDLQSYASTSKNSESYSSLGKKGDISIDYDELSKDNENFTEDKCYEMTDQNESIGGNSQIYEVSEDNLDSQNMNCSQNSEVFQILDKELDYSMHKSKLERPDNFAIGGISIIDDLSSLASFKKSVDNNQVENIALAKEISPIKHRRITEIATPQKACSTVTVLTPKNSEFIIKTNNVTPMLDYETMSTPEIHKELDKYGIKPFKRKRAIQLLTHIYNQTHPIVENDDEFASPPKRHKPDNFTPPIKQISPRKILQSPKKPVESEKEDGHRNKKSKEKGAINRIQHNVFLEVPNSTEVECKPEDWVFQKREKAKVHTCRVPLHIAFYNYVRFRSDLREAILRYEPVNIDDIHKDLVAVGHRYDPKDLLKFLDKKCITVKTTDNDARNQKR